MNQSEPPSPLRENQSRTNGIIQSTAAALSKLGDSMGSTRVILPWILSAMGSPAWIIGYLAPIREAGSLAFQPAFSATLQSREFRKTFWSTGAMVQGLAMGAMGVVAFLLESRPVVAGMAFLVLIAIFSLGRGISSVSFKDVLGKTVDQGSRGKVMGFATFLSGWGSLAIGLYALFYNKDNKLSSLLLFPFLAALFFIGAGIVYRFTREKTRSQVETGTSILSQYLLIPEFLKKDPNLRNFLFIRGLLTGSALSLPFYVLIFQELIQSKIDDLPAWVGHGPGSWIIAGGIASSLGGALWGHLSDRASRNLLGVAGLLFTGNTLLFLTLFSLYPGAILVTAFFFTGSFFHEGIRIARKTYLVDVTGGNDRTRYTATANTVTGAFLMLVGLLSTLEPWIGGKGVLLLYSLLTLFGSGGAFALKRPGTVD